uniref:Zodarin 4 n=1 Tax=Zodarion cyrenaicum TaxID=2283614 RepID=A0A8D7ZT96_9ARAC|nr:Zodarin 4 precursor [Zodarion cyrenaicum]
MKLCTAIFLVWLTSFCVAETLSYAIDDEMDEELIQIVNQALMEEVYEVIGKENFEFLEEKREFRFDENTIFNFAKKVASLIKTAKKCWKELRGKKDEDEEQKPE